MKFDYDNNAICEKHASEPKPGDYWHEMFCGVCVVIEVLGRTVIFCKTKKDVSDNKWTWDLSKLDSLTIDEFRKWLSYETIPGFWADCVPEKHMWAVNALRSGAV